MFRSTVPSDRLQTGPDCCTNLVELFGHSERRRKKRDGRRREGRRREEGAEEERKKGGVKGRVKGKRKEGVGRKREVRS